MKAPAIKTSNLCKRYGDQKAVDQLTLEIKPGSIYGLLGRNGAGKSTTMRILAGLCHPDAGSVLVNGSSPGTFGAAERQKVTYVSENQNLPYAYRVKALVDFCAAMYDHWDSAYCTSLLEKFGISGTDKVGKLSLGKQRILAIILNLAPRPDVLLLDEPSANLDVVSRRDFLEELLALTRDGSSTVVFSTHILSDVERVADEIGIIHQGCLRVSESLDTLKESIVKVRFHGFEHIPSDLPPECLSWKGAGNEALAVLHLKDERTVDQLASKWNCRSEINPMNLEDIFVELSRSN